LKAGAIRELRKENKNREDGFATMGIASEAGAKESAAK
jgi:hypothetical protein